MKSREISPDNLIQQPLSAIRFAARELTKLDFEAKHFETEAFQVLALKLLPHRPVSQQESEIKILSFSRPAPSP